MKQFFKYSFATMFGIFLTFFFLIIIGAMIAGVSSRNSKTVAKANSVLKTSFNVPIVDRGVPSGFNFQPGSFGPTESLGLNDILDNIEKAKTDDNIKGMYFELTDIPAGMASVEEIRKKLLEFKETGKFIVTYSEVMTQKAYYLASVADEIYLNPQGLVMLNGFSANWSSIKGMLDKLEIEPKIFYAGNFKSATEPLRYEKMSEYNKLQTRELLNGFYGSFLENVAAGRNMSESQLHQIIDELKVQTANDAKKYKVVDKVAYIDQVYDNIKERLAVESDEDINFMSLSKYTDVENEDKSFKKNKVAVVYASGGIVDGEGEDTEIGSARYVKALRKVRKDDNVKAVVLRIDSGGGSALASEIIWRELELIKAKGIPVIASMGDVAASGGYYIACNADTILAESNTITGSIGVFGMMADISKLYNNKLGITFDTVKTTKFSDFPNSAMVTRAFTEAEERIVQSSVDRIYLSFKSRVADGRNMSLDAVQEVAQGRVWTGTQAKENGLVDVIGGLEMAINMAAEKAGLATDDYRLTNYPIVEDPFEKIMKEITGGSSTAQTEILKAELGSLFPYFEQIKSLEKMKGVQARLPFVIEVQ
ncbi:MAG: signal peptide peptidase SppA [Chitinophagales bacterium]